MALSHLERKIESTHHALNHIRLVNGHQQLALLYNGIPQLAELWNDQKVEQKRRWHLYGVFKDLIPSGVQKTSHIADNFLKA